MICSTGHKLKPPLGRAAKTQPILTFDSHTGLPVAEKTYFPGEPEIIQNDIEDEDLDRVWQIEEMIRKRNGVKRRDLTREKNRRKHYR